ncbi:protein quiver-like [Mizuhopecten yessoensis]|uniref:Protein quiver n=1 Tax=Mizuhopecten yessoensis TaxID=6573 RepID=A0A210QR19_MIZYE|nr:protein quiver-like [Mizuhopecten yessoensis]OWF51169.1 Protein quiver [Mizuhopecten yessoensis]
MERWLASLLLLCLFFIVGAASIKCYSCNYPDEKCGDYFAYTNPDANDCQGSCVKRRGTREGGGVEVYRGCNTQKNTYCTQSDYVGMNVRECYCNEDYCNHSNSVRVSAVSLVIAFITVLYNLL